MRKLCTAIVSIVGGIAVCIGVYFLLLWIIFHPVHLEDADYLHERGMFQDVDIVRCAYTQDLEPKCKRLVSLMFPIELSYFGTAELSDETLEKLLDEYTWETCTVTQEDWEKRFYPMSAFKVLKKQYVGKTFYICYAFDRERMSYGGDGRGFLVPGTNTMYFYYHRM